MDDAPALRVLTLNVYGPANPDWERRRRVLATALHEADADVLALQEVPVDDGFAVVRELAGDGYASVLPFPAAGDPVGGVLLTRWPATEVQHVEQHVTERSRDFAWCATLLADLATPVGDVLVVHHKPSWPFPQERERELQAVAAARAIETRVGGREVVVLGDFDATPDAASSRFWRGRQSLDGLSVHYRDAWQAVHGDAPGHTFVRRNPLVAAGQVATAEDRRIDHVLVRSGDHGPGLVPRRCDLLLDEPVLLDGEGVWASDHFGVVADLVPSPHPPGSWASTAV